jgi:hypothetical protein
MFQSTEVLFWERLWTYYFQKPPPTSTSGLGNTTPLVAEDSVPFVTSLKAPAGSGQALVPGKVSDDT